MRYADTLLNQKEDKKKNQVNNDNSYNYIFWK